MKIMWKKEATKSYITFFEEKKNVKNVFTKTGKKGEEKMIKRKTAETTGRVERERERERERAMFS